jgi:MFS family permease
MTAAIDSRRAWAVVAGAMLANAIGFGTVYSFGAFFDAMAADFGSGRSATALVFSLTLLLFFGFGAISGPLADRFGPRVMVVAGAVLFCSGLLGTSRVGSVGLGYVTYGLGVGMGCGCWVTPLTATAGAWFERRRALALGLTAAGSGLGTLVLSPSTARLIDTYGWRRTYVVLAVVGAVGLSVVALLVDRPPVPRLARAGAHLRAVSRTRQFRLLFVSGLLMSAALYTPFTFLVSFAKQDGVPASQAALLVGLIGASSIGGRLGLTGLAGRLGPLRLYQVCLGLQVGAYLVWLVAGGSYPVLVTFAVLLGISYGGFVALGPEVVIRLFGVSGFASVLGLVYFGSGIGGFIGPVAGGALVDATGSHRAPILFAAVTVALATTATLAVVDHRVDLDLPRDPAPAR